MDVNKTLNFLKKLQIELQTQHIEYQAPPRFWVIKDYKQVLANESYDDGYWIYFYNDGDYIEFKTKEQLVADLKCYDYDSCLYFGDTLKYYMDNEKINLESLFDFILENFNDNGFFGKVYMKEVSEISSDTMFITQEDALNHLKLNNYHYSNKAHIYAMTAWRSPSVERLWDILENFDWEQVSK